MFTGANHRHHVRVDVGDVAEASERLRAFGEPGLGEVAGLPDGLALPEPQYVHPPAP